MDLSSQQETETMICGLTGIAQLTIGQDLMEEDSGTEDVLQLKSTISMRTVEPSILMVSGSDYHLWK